MPPPARLPPLDLVKGFVAVARRMSVTQAAEDLCLTQSAVSKQVRALEQALGVPLFRRGFRKLELTAHGQQLFRAADASLQQLQDALAALAAPVKKPVTITASTGVAGLWLLPRLGALRQQHPGVDVRVVSSNAVLDVGTEADLAIRYCAGPQAPRDAVKLFGEAMAPVASPALGVSAFDADALPAATLLEFDVGGRPWLHWDTWLAARGWGGAAAGGVLRYNQYEQVIQAAVAGHGIALGRLPLVQDLLDDGRLQLLPCAGVQHADHAYWLVAGKDAPDEVRRVAAWIAAQARPATMRA